MTQASLLDTRSRALETHWVITRRARFASKAEHVADVAPSAAGLAAFLEACDTGKPGTYTLRGNASRQTYELATGKVGVSDMEILWQPAWILFALGAKGLAEEVDGVVAFLREHGALPKEDE